MTKLYAFIGFLAIVSACAMMANANNEERLWNVQIQWYSLQDWNGYSYDIIYPPENVLSRVAGGPEMEDYLVNVVGVDIYNTTQCPTTDWLPCDGTSPSWRWSWYICDCDHLFTIMQGR